jgi:hypothetical protein
VDTLSVRVLFDARAAEPHFWVRVGACPAGASASFPPSSQSSLPMSRIAALRESLRAHGAAPPTQPFPALSPRGRCDPAAGDRDALALELWLGDVLARWWQLPLAAKEAVATALELRGGPDTLHGGPSLNPRAFSIGDESLHAQRSHKPEKETTLRTPLVDPS